MLASIDVYSKIMQNFRCMNVTFRLFIYLIGRKELNLQTEILRFGHGKKKCDNGKGCEHPHDKG